VFFFLSEMSYNGVGLQTPRGSGTNGYVQRNLAAVPTYRKQVFTDDFKKPPTSAKKPNLAIIEHERKRQVEVQLLLYEEKLANMKYSEEEIARKVEKVREQLLQRLRSGKPITDDGPAVETHELSAAKEKEMARITAAFGIKNDHVEGAVFEKMGYEGERQEKTKEKELMKQVQEQNKGPKLSQNWLLRLSGYTSDEDDAEERKKKARKRETSKKDHKKRSRSQSPSRSRSRSRGRPRKLSQENDRPRNRERDREREKAKVKTKEKEKEKPKEKLREKNKEKDTREDRDNEKEIKEKDRGNEREREKDRGNEKEREKEREKEKEPRDKDRGRDKDKEKTKKKRQ